MRGTIEFGSRRNPDIIYFSCLRFFLLFDCCLRWRVRLMPRSFLWAVGINRACVFASIVRPQEFVRRIFICVICIEAQSKPTGGRNDGYHNPSSVTSTYCLRGFGRNNDLVERFESPLASSNLLEKNLLIARPSHILYSLAHLNLT